MGTKVEEVLQAIKQQLGDIRVDRGYRTNIGATILLHDEQRGSTERPSIAVGSRSGRINRRDERGDAGRALSRKARRLEFVVASAVDGPSDQAEQLGHDMLEDIEVAMERRTGLAPMGTIELVLDNWEILDRPAGIDAVVLQIYGHADYLRT